MQTLNWLESHLESLDEIVKTLNRDFCWNMEIVEGLNGSKWFIKSGESVIFTADNRDAVDAFIYGMGIPDNLFDDLRKNMQAWCADVTGESNLQDG